MTEQELRSTLRVNDCYLTSLWDIDLEIIPALIRDFVLLLIIYPIECVILIFTNSIITDHFTLYVCLNEPYKILLNCTVLP